MCVVCKAAKKPTDKSKHALSGKMGGQKWKLGRGGEGEMGWAEGDEKRVGTGTPASQRARSKWEGGVRSLAIIYLVDCGLWFFYSFFPFYFTKSVETSYGNNCFLLSLLLSSS